MIELYLSPEANKICLIDADENIVDISDKMQEELNLYDIFKGVTGETELIVDEPEPEWIYSYIVEKAYLSGTDNRDWHRLHEYTYNLTDKIKKKILSAFTTVFIRECENKLGNRVEINYL